MHSGGIPNFNNHRAYRILFQLYRTVNTVRPVCLADYCLTTNINGTRTSSTARRHASLSDGRTYDIYYNVMYAQSTARPLLLVRSMYVCFKMLHCTYSPFHFLSVFIMFQYFLERNVPLPLVYTKVSTLNVRLVQNAGL
jgi:hypothetical protein